MQEHKKMTMMQLTVVVAVNMMGSGIIMLPTNMAKVGAISLLSWIVTAIGSMAIAYGFAQAGLFNQRPGGMAAYSEDAYGKGGYFLTFLLYFFSLAIGNVAIAISAVGYLAGFFPGMSATPIATCISVIVLVWLTTVANFGGPSITGKIGAITVWGVIIPVAGLSVIGWFWFKGDTFMQAWNPKGLSLFEGMGSSIALTLWAFLGMESAAQNSDAVENPKRDVPLACMLGTLGAAVIYVLSTTVIQGIVPNADLAKSTGPFALAYAQMFNPTIGSIIMALAVLACLGSLLGWQFTIAQTAKTAAADRLFPTLFAKVNNKGAPLAGMIVMAIVQSVLALSTISPTLSEQFSALVNLAVVTNVIPYIISLSALFVMMKVAGVSEAVYKRNGWIVAIAMLYSTYAIYASGKDAVLGGTIVLALTYVLYGFLAPRFVGGSTAARKPAGAAGTAIAAIAVAFLATFAPPPAEAGTLDRVRQANKLTLGYRADARPFSYRDESGNAAGYSVELCQKVAAQVKAGLSMSSLAVEWVPVTLESRFRDVQQGKVDLLCGADSVTLSRRKEVAFSIPIFPGGIGALLRRDAPLGLRDVLNEGTAAPRPFWRGSPAAILTEKVFGVIPKTTTESWAVEKLATLKITARLVGVDTYAAGVQQVTDRGVDAFFGDRPILLDAAKRSPSGSDLIVLDRRFTYEPIALGLQRDDDDFRLLVDRTLSELFRLHEFRDLYAKWFGEPDQSALVFFGLSALPE
jgi:putrescine:ornithine antiporter